MSNNVAEKVQQAQLNVVQGIKSKIFDIIAVFIVIVLVAVSLGIIERRIVTWNEIGDLLVECIPFFFAAMLLNDNYYMKGSFAGKLTDKFKNACKKYTGYIDDLTGEQIDCLDEFCERYNYDALVKMQESFLHRASISYERFANGEKPIKTWSKKELMAEFGKYRAVWIIKAQHASIKGLRVNTLMGTNDSDDITDIGETESQLSSRRRISGAVMFSVSTILMALIGIKDVASWGWIGVALVIFKCIYILCRSFMSYFDGYNDITIHLVNHIERKEDILKQFIYWFESNKKTEVIK